MGRDRLLFVLCLLAACLTQFASDIYAPALVLIADALHTTRDNVQWSMALYLMGVSLSLIVYGPLSEGIGRRKPLLIGLALMVLGSLLSWRAGTMNTLLWGRFIQGLGAGATAGLWAAVFRDVFSGERLAKYSSHIALFVMLSLSLAPAIGGSLAHTLGWRSIFAFIALYSLCVFLFIAFGYKETSKGHDKSKLRPSFIWGTYTQLFTHPAFLAATLATFFSYGAYFSVFVVTPLLLIQGAGMTAASFGWLLFAGSGIAYAAAGLLNSKLVGTWGTARLMRAGWLCMLIAGVWLLASTWWGGLTIWAIAPPVFLFFFGSTFIWPNAFTTAMSPFPHIAGYAGVSYRLMLLGGGALIGALVSYLPDDSQLPLASILILSTLLAWCSFEYFERRAPHEKT